MSGPLLGVQVAWLSFTTSALPGARAARDALIGFACRAREGGDARLAPVCVLAVPFSERRLPGSAVVHLSSEDSERQVLLGHGLARTSAHVLDHGLVPARARVDLGDATRFTALSRITLDFPVFNGNSGGPVILFERSRTYGGKTYLGQTTRFVVGLVSKIRGATETLKYLDEVRAVRHSLELAVIVHATAIRETIEKLLPEDPFPSRN